MDAIFRQLKHFKLVWDSYSLATELNKNPKMYKLLHFELLETFSMQ